MVPGKCLYIPAYWWYSMQFTKNASVTCLYYRTYMNTVAITPQLILFFLQNQNVKRTIVKKKLQVALSETEETEETNENENEKVNENEIEIEKKTKENS